MDKEILENISPEDQVSLIKEGLKVEIYNELKDKLLRGEAAEIPGLGSLFVSTRKVKNDEGRNFAVMVRLKQSLEFSEKLVKEYSENPEKFS